MSWVPWADLAMEGKPLVISEDRRLQWCMGPHPAGLHSLQQPHLVMVTQLGRWVLWSPWNPAVWPVTSASLCWPLKSSSGRMSLPSMSSQRAWWHLFLTKLENSAILLALAMKDREAWRWWRPWRKVIRTHARCGDLGAAPPAVQEGHEATQTPPQGFEGPALVRRRNSLALALEDGINTNISGWPWFGGWRPPWEEDRKHVLRMLWVLLPRSRQLHMCENWWNESWTSIVGGNFFKWKINASSPRKKKEEETNRGRQIQKPKGTIMWRRPSVSHLQCSRIAGCISDSTLSFHPRKRSIHGRGRADIFLPVAVFQPLPPGV